MYMWAVLYVEKIIRKSKIFGKSKNVRIRMAVYVRV